MNIYTYIYIYIFIYIYIYMHTRLYTVINAHIYMDIYGYICGYAWDVLFGHPLVVGHEMSSLKLEVIHRWTMILCIELERNPVESQSRCRWRCWRCRSFSGCRCPYQVDLYLEDLMRWILNVMQGDEMQSMRRDNISWYVMICVCLHIYIYVYLYTRVFV